MQNFHIRIKPRVFFYVLSLFYKPTVKFFSLNKEHSVQLCDFLWLSLCTAECIITVKLPPGTKSEGNVNLSSVRVLR